MFFGNSNDSFVFSRVRISSSQFAICYCVLVISEWSFVLFSKIVNWSGSSLEAVVPQPLKGAKKFFLVKKTFRFIQQFQLFLAHPLPPWKHLVDYLYQWKCMLDDISCFFFAYSKLSSCFTTFQSCNSVNGCPHDITNVIMECPDLSAKKPLKKRIL